MKSFSVIVDVSTRHRRDRELPYGNDGFTAVPEKDENV